MKKHLSQHKDETPLAYMGRMVSWLEQETDTAELPTLEACFDCFDMITIKYDVSLLSEVVECLYVGDHPGAYNSFINKHKLPWNKFRNGNFEEKY